MDPHQISGVLRSRLIGQPKPNGEWDMRCPLLGHEDAHRSASLNIKKGQWYCFACAKGGSVSSLLQSKVAEFEDEEEVFAQFSGLPSERNVVRYHQALLSSRRQLKLFQRARGISLASIKQFKVGWNSKALLGKGAYTIPVYDIKGKLANIRSYNKNNEPKIWSVRGYGVPRLYPLEQLKRPGPIVIVEGEWDAILTIQRGFNAITRTGAADVWKPAWTSLFQGREVYLCHDADAKGKAANEALKQILTDVAEAVYVVRLPYSFQEKHGKDLTDYFHVDKHTAEDFKDLLQDAKPFGRQVPVEHVSLSESLDGKRYVGSTLVITGRVRGQSEVKSLPMTVRYFCDHNMGEMCVGCPLEDKTEQTITLPEERQGLVDFLEATPQQQERFIRTAHGLLNVPRKCTALQWNELAWHQVVDLDIRPPLNLLDFSGDTSEDVNAKRRLFVFNKDLRSNEVVDFTGRMHRLKNTDNIFVAHKAERSEDDLDMFETSDTMIEYCREMQCRPSDSLEMILQIGSDLSTYTGVVGRPEVHTMLDLVWHSAIQFVFGGFPLTRGWLECLLIGEPRTGKSTAATRMLQLYGLGEFINCESSTAAGIMGGLVQRPSGGWIVNMGAFPFNDRGLVILDEVSGLSKEQISQLSDMRARGVLKITKIENEQASARVRSIWLSNPRDFEYVNGVDAIEDLIGKGEDIARFDMAYAIQDEVSVGEVVPENRPMSMFTKETYRALVRWAWTRKPSEIRITKDAEAEAKAQGAALSKRYSAKPPLVLSGDAPDKVIRMAVAIAQRTFSTRTGDDVIVTRDHVLAAVKFLDILYEDEVFGYAEVSRTQLAAMQTAFLQEPNILQLMSQHPTLHGYLRRNGMRGFRAQDLREQIGVDFDTANALTNRLENFGLLHRDGQKTVLTSAGKAFMRRTRQ